MSDAHFAYVSSSGSLGESTVSLLVFAFPLNPQWVMNSDIGDAIAHDHQTGLILSQLVLGQTEWRIAHKLVSYPFTLCLLPSPLLPLAKHNSLHRVLKECVKSGQSLVEWPSQSYDLMPHPLCGVRVGTHVITTHEIWKYFETFSRALCSSLQPLASLKLHDDELSLYGPLEFELCEAGIKVWCFLCFPAGLFIHVERDFTTYRHQKRST